MLCGSGIDGSNDDADDTNHHAESAQCVTHHMAITSMNHDLPPRIQKFSMKALCASFGYAWQGLVFVVRTQRNMRIHVGAALLTVFIGLCSDLSRDDWLWLMLAITLVVSAELLNSALEYVCDVVMPEYHESIKRAKDIAAAAVLICACFALCVGVMVLIGG